MRVTLLVSFDVYATKDDVGNTLKPTRAEASAYVEDAVASWGGQRNPNDPFFEVVNVRVRPSRKPRKSIKEIKRP